MPNKAYPSAANGRLTTDYRDRRAGPTLQGRVKRRLDFSGINRAALSVLPALLARWLPGGRVESGREFVALNPRRCDRNLGSFRINLCTGRWADFATDHRGGDVISLAAYLAGLRQGEAARRLAAVLGVEIGQ